MLFVVVVVDKTTFYSTLCIASLFQHRLFVFIVDEVHLGIFRGLITVLGTFGKIWIYVHLSCTVVAFLLFDYFTKIAFFICSTSERLYHIFCLFLFNFEASELCWWGISLLFSNYTTVILWVIEKYSSLCAHFFSVFSLTTSNFKSESVPFQIVLPSYIVFRLFAISFKTFLTSVYSNLVQIRFSFDVLFYMSVFQFYFLIPFYFIFALYIISSLLFLYFFFSKLLHYTLYIYSNKTFYELTFVLYCGPLVC